jgi:hypothetical protein
MLNIHQAWNEFYAVVTDANEGYFLLFEILNEY